MALDGRSTLPDGAGASLWDSEQYYQAIERMAARSSPATRATSRRASRSAAAYIKTGERAAAVGEYQRVLEIAPDNAEARRALGGG